MPALRSGKRYRPRPRLERETLLAPQAAAERVIEETTGWIGTRLPRRYALRLAWQARIIFAQSPSFREKIRRPGDRGRDLLHDFMRHWLAARLKSERPELFRALPAGFAWGESPAAPAIRMPPPPAARKLSPPDLVEVFLSPDARLLVAV